MVSIAYSIALSNDNKQSLAYNSKMKDDENNMDNLNRLNENKYTTRKPSKVSPSVVENTTEPIVEVVDFEPKVEIITEPPVDTTIKTHATKEPSRRTKSLLCNVYTPPDLEETNESIPTQSTRWSFLRRCSWLSRKKTREQPLIEYNEPSHSNDYNDKLTSEPSTTKKVSWLSGLLQKRQENKVRSTKKSFSISNFLRSKKRKQQQNITAIPPLPPLPERYPIHIERVIYRLSTMRLSDHSRPFRDQLLTSNMLSQYHRVIQSQNELFFNGSFQLVNSLLYQQQRLQVVN